MGDTHNPPAETSLCTLSKCGLWPFLTIPHSATMNHELIDESPGPHEAATIMECIILWMMLTDTPPARLLAHLLFS